MEGRRRMIRKAEITKVEFEEADKVLRIFKF